jgi:nitrite reductase/ring-hydroxylating ferredoxin subunit
MPDDPGAGSTWVQLKRVKVDEMADGTIIRVDVFGTRMALACVEGSFFAVEGKCPHGPGQLGDGDLDGHVVTCPVHGLEYDVRDGLCVTDSEFAVSSVPVRVKDNMVLVMAPT